MPEPVRLDDGRIDGGRSAFNPLHVRTVLHKIITRPALANEREKTNAAGQVVLRPTKA